MATPESSATAYDTLSEVTTLYVILQERLDDLRILRRVLQSMAVNYRQAGDIETPLSQAVAALSDLVHIERNRLYAESTRLSDEMERLNAFIQNGGHNG